MSQMRFELGTFQIQVRNITPCFKFLGTCLGEWLGCDFLNFSNDSASSNTVGINVLAYVLWSYVVGSKSFLPDIQKPRQMENAVRDI